MSRKPVEIERGARFGRLTVQSTYIQRTYVEPPNESSSEGWYDTRTYSRVRCDCGVEKEVPSSALRAGAIRSCGCWQPEVATKHGASRTRLYEAWHYARGSWEDWEEFTGFAHWALHSGYDEEEGRVYLNRINKRLGHSPGNCVWMKTRRTGSLYAAWGERKGLREWAQDTRCSVSYPTLATRVREGWGVEEAISTPPRKAGRKSSADERGVAESETSGEEPRHP